MSVEVLTELAKAAARDLSAQQRYEAMSDAELACLGLDEQEIGSIRRGFFDRVLRLGIWPDEPPGGCCGGV